MINHNYPSDQGPGAVTVSADYSGSTAAEVLRSRFLQGSHTIRRSAHRRRCATRVRDARPGLDPGRADEAAPGAERHQLHGDQHERVGQSMAGEMVAGCHRANLYGGYT